MAHGRGDGCCGRGCCGDGGCCLNWDYWDCGDFWDLVLVVGGDALRIATLSGVGALTAYAGLDDDE